MISINEYKTDLQKIGKENLQSNHHLLIKKDLKEETIDTDQILLVSYINFGYD